MATLAHHGFGACLADDMGLGKTLQAPHRAACASTWARRWWWCPSQWSPTGRRRWPALPPSSRWWCSTIPPSGRP